MHAIAAPSSVRLRTSGPPAASLLASAAVAGALVLTLWVAFAAHAPADFDQDLYGSIHGSPGTAETGFAKHLTAIGDGPPLIAVLGLLGLATWAAWRRWEPLAVTVLALVVGSAASTVLKVAAGRHRPPSTGWMSDAGGNSFPSGHTTATTAGYLTLAMCVAVLLRTVWARVLVLAAGAAIVVGIGWTRVELGVHWPTDVLAGWAVGTGAACVALACWRLAPPNLRP